MSVEGKIRQLRTDRLSYYKTHHNFECYVEITSLGEYQDCLRWAKKNNRDIFFLGNGSNTLFTNKTVKSLVVKNKIPREIKCISEENHLYEVTSSVFMREILNYCNKLSLDSFYFLSSVPATIGGALAMNAGEGRRLKTTIYDYVESVTYIDSDNSIKTIQRKELEIGYRNTMFTGCQDKFIISAIFRFSPKDMGGVNPLKERLIWSKEKQDNVAPNCGSVFKDNSIRIMRLLKGLKIGKAQYSSKTSNWINNKSKSSYPIIMLIIITKILHFIILKKCNTEIILVK